MNDSMGVGDHVLLRSDDPPPFRVLNPLADKPLILVCDHAGNRVPAALDHLGLSTSVFQTEHMAVDLGAARVTELMAEAMGVTAVIATYSRLVIDCNRPPGDLTSIPPVSDGLPIPGNQDLSLPQTEARMEAIFWPYHHAITREVARIRHSTTAPAVISVHSFTPKLHTGEPRPWHLGVLWKHDSRLSKPVLEWFDRETEYCVGDNQPYSGHQVGFTVDTHAESSGLPHVLFEIRQDLLADENGCRTWAELLMRALNDVLAADPTIHRIEYF